MTDDNEPGFWVRLEAHLGGVNKRLDRLAQMQASANKTVQPVFGRQTAQPVIANAAGIAIFDFSGPTQGVIWHIRSITVGGLTPSTAAAGRADVFVSATDPGVNTTLATLGLSDWRDQSAALPNIAFYGNGAMVLRPNEDPLIIVSGATVGQVYMATVSFMQVQEGAIAQSWAE